MSLTPLLLALLAICCIELPAVETVTLLVIRCRAADAPAWSDPPERAQLESELATSDAFFRHESWGQSGFAATIGLTPVLDLPQTIAAYRGDLGDLISDSLAAAKAAGFDPADYDREVLISNKELAASTGVAFGSFAVVQPQLEGYVFLHEMGHTFGMRHAAVWRSKDDHPRADDGSSEEYGDDFDTMGKNGVQPFHIWNRHKAGWISVADGGLTKPTSSGTWRIYNQLEATRLPGKRYGLVIQLADALSNVTEPKYMNKESLVLEYRHDEYFANQVIVHTSHEPHSNSMQQHRLDLTPGTDSLSDSGLPIGSTYQDTCETFGPLLVRPVATGSDNVAGVVHEWIEVEVVLGTDEPPTRSVTLRSLGEGWAWTSDTGVDPATDGETTTYADLPTTLDARFQPAPASTD